jgi:O-antigen biosynthesis protein
MTIDIIMPTLEQTAVTIRAIQSIPHASKRHQTRLIWIDNGSSEAHRRRVYEAIQTTQLLSREILMDENRGFPNAVNLGLAHSTENLILLLNNDVEFTQPGALDILAEDLISTEGAGMSAPAASSGWQKPANLAKMRWMTDAGSPAISTPVTLERDHHPAFFCTLITRQAFHDVGYLTEAVGDGFGEDDDYNERMHAAGWKRLLCLNAFVQHDHRTTWKSMYSGAEIREKQEQSMSYLRKKYGRQVW